MNFSISSSFFLKGTVSLHFNSVDLFLEYNSLIINLVSHFLQLVCKNLYFLILLTFLRVSLSFSSEKLLGHISIKSLLNHYWIRTNWLGLFFDNILAINLLCKDLRLLMKLLWGWVVSTTINEPVLLGLCCSLNILLHLPFYLKVIFIFLLNSAFFLYLFLFFFFYLLILPFQILSILFLLLELLLFNSLLLLTLFPFCLFDLQFQILLHFNLLFLSLLILQLTSQSILKRFSSKALKDFYLPCDTFPLLISFT